jgi:hypothetical protein
MKDSRSSRDVPPPPPPAAPTGARHDDSSLFSLDALKKTEEEARKQKDRDDSGLIDLKELAAIERDRRPKPEMTVATVVAPPDLFQLSTPIVPIAAQPISVGPPALAKPRDPRRTNVLIAAGAVIAVLAAVGVFVATRGGPEALPVAVVGAAPAPSPTVPPPAAAPPEEPKPAAVTPGMRPTADPPPPPAAVPVPAPLPKPAGVAPRSAPAPRAAPGPKADSPAPKPANACDLACQMQRAVSGKK